MTYDMRGVARSGQVECWNDKEYSAAVDAALGVPGPGALHTAVRQGLDFAHACQDETPPEPIARRTTGIEADETRDVIPVLR
ncbi:hypothetical protein [Streptomyces sp. KS 21]|uniref:hypothetical protein n=1 Tax=Streptomyces sp. KS 21 TaxID=2485150 RepID=UPI0010D5A6D4|nr:hypothetical protein [Streptomyces sp. KS 21]TDU73993.1 hypothetical protein EDD91_0619 [Streptomyces sp. KS 21]